MQWSVYLDRNILVKKKKKKNFNTHVSAKCRLTHI